MIRTASLACLPVQRPSLALFGAEPLRAALEFLAHKVASAQHTAKGDGHPVVLFPGLGADGTSLAPLRRHCQSLGYTAMDWGRGHNRGPKGDIDLWLAQLADDVGRLTAGSQHKMTLIGWSLGGLYARELAKLIHGKVRQVITIGTPFNAEADHTNVGWAYRLLSGSEAAVDAVLSARLRQAPPVPTTSIYSRSDGVVAWQTCRHDKPGRRVQDIEISGSHLGMGWNPAVLGIVADRLAQRQGSWRPYAAP